MLLQSGFSGHSLLYKSGCLELAYHLWLMIWAEVHEIFQIKECLFSSTLFLDAD